MTVDIWDRIAREGETPSRQQPKRLARRDLRIGDRLPAAIAELTIETLRVPRGTRHSEVPTFLSSVPASFEGRIPLAKGDSPYWLALCVDAPRRLFDRGFGPIWLSTHVALQDQVDAAGRYTPRQARSAPNYRIERAVAGESVAAWLDAAYAALARSKDGLRGRL